MLSCTDAELESLLDPSEVIGAIRAAFARGFDAVRMPQRLHLEVDGTTQLIMPCARAGEPLWGMKMVSVSGEPRPEGRVRAEYLLLDDCSRTIAVFEANYLTDLRTAATSAIATDILARHDVETLGIFGTGRQAASHLAILRRFRNFEKVFVCGSTLEKSEAFATRMRQQLPLNVVACNALACASSSDVICTCTSSSEPLFPADSVRSGAHLNLIGAFEPYTREVDSELISRSRVFVDTNQAAMTEAGDILIPLNEGKIRREHICGDLHELAAGKKAGRTRDSDITVFKSVGCALEDLVTAKLALSALQKRSTSA